MLKSIKQRHKSDCALAAIAMVTGLSYNHVAKLCGSVRGGMEKHEEEWLLRELGAEWKRGRVNWKQPETAMQWAQRNPDKLALLAIASCLPWEYGHAIAACDGATIDPATGLECVNNRDVISVIIITKQPTPPTRKKTTHVE